MNKFRSCFLVALYLAAPSAIAAQQKADDCNLMDQMAESVMKARQHGVPMAEMYKASVTGEDTTSMVFKMLIDGAYKEARFSTEEYQDKAVVDFRDVIFQACQKSNEARS